MRRCYGLLISAVCAAGGCQSSPQGLDPFLGPQRISPPPTGAAVPNGAAPYFSPGSAAPTYQNTPPVVTPGTAAPIAPGGTAPANSTYNYTPSSLKTDGAASPDRSLVPQTSAAASTIAFPGKTAAWNSGSTGGEPVRIVEPAGVTQASFTTPSLKTPASSAPIEVGPMVDITSLPNPKR